VLESTSCTQLFTIISLYPIFDKHSCGGIKEQHCWSISLSVLLCKCISSLVDEPIQMKLYTVAVYNLRMCMEEVNPGLKYIKGDN